MPRHRIPKHAGKFDIVRAMAGNWAVWNNLRGKNRVWIVCRDKQHGEDVRDRLNAKNRPDEIWI
jgi:hypothetical protein